MARFSDRVAIVTGAGARNGIRAAVARQLVDEGAQVVLGATSDRIHDRAAELGDAAAHESASFVTGAVLVADGGHGLPETWPRP